MRKKDDVPEPTKKQVNDVLEKLEREIVPPVDFSQRCLTDCSPVTPDHKEIDPYTKQQKAYVVLSEEERSKGYVRPVRFTYTHKKCNTDTSMGSAIAETYAREPHFYSGTFCYYCKQHFQLDEFVWKDTDELLGT